MINQAIAQSIAEKVVDEFIVTRATGCAKLTQIGDRYDVTSPVMYKSATGGQTSCQVNPKMFSFLPNSKEKAILYFEDLGETCSDFGSRYEEWKGTLKANFWINGNTIDPNNISGIKRKLIDNLKHTITASDGIIGGTVKVKTIHGTSEKPYKNCNLDEKNKQYLTLFIFNSKFH